MSIADALNQIARAANTRVGPADKAGDDGLVAASASGLASAAGCNLDEYSLARMVASEYGDHAPPYQLACACVAVNKARQAGVSVYDLLTRSKRSSGSYGQQGTGRWASTRLPPTQKNLVAAQRAIAGDDISGGAIDFFEPGGQVVGARQGTAPIRQSAKEYIDARAREGLVWVGKIDEIDANVLMMFRRKTSGDDQKVAEAKEVVSDGSATAFLILCLAVAIVGALSV